MDALLPQSDLHSNQLEHELNTVLIQPVNTHKHVFNNQDGGRTRKQRHVSIIARMSGGTDALNGFCKDLFNVRSVTPSVQEGNQMDFGMTYSQILEERNEESPDGKADQSMRTSSQVSQTEFRINAVTCSNEGDEATLNDEEQLTQEQT